MAKIYPDEFRNDVVKVARKGDATLTQVAKDFGIGYQTLLGWMKRADVEDGVKPGLKKSELDNVKKSSSNRTPGFCFFWNPISRGRRARSAKSAKRAD